MRWIAVEARGGTQVGAAFVDPGDGQPEHEHPEAQVLYLAHGRLRVWSPSLQGAVDQDGPAEFRFLPRERHGWEAIEPSVVFSMWGTV